MKFKLIYTFIIMVGLQYSNAQDIIGIWNGLLKVPGTELRLAFNLSKVDNKYVSTMDSPDQGAKDIPTTSTNFENNVLNIVLKNLMIEYKGELKGDEIVGTFKQGTFEIPLTLSRKAIEKKAIKRPQEPVKPYPYKSEEVVFRNAKADISLAGTLTTPSDGTNFPVVVLITGSGAQNRDEELLGHKPFLVIADYLTRNGIAVLRFDDRGTAESGGDFSKATTYDFATDVESAVDFLKTREDINKNKIGLLGHSEGGIIAPIVASRSKDINFIVLLAGTGIRGDKLLLSQQEAISRASGASEEQISGSLKINENVMNLVINSTDATNLKLEITKILNDYLDNNSNNELHAGMTREQFINIQTTQICQPWMLSFIKLDPAIYLEKVKCPVLALNGDKDLQVPPKENLSAIKAALHKGGNNDVTTIEYPNLNHLFQECTTGLPAEYSEIEQTISPKVLKDISLWILNSTTPNK